MDKRYQVFVSSTYVDLKEERQNVIQTLMEMDCIPAGMELFPAADEEQWEFIKRVIDDCDYYLLIVGGRYGSTAEDGLSYTEKEFDYAVSKGVKVIALLHESPESLPRGKTENSDELYEKLNAFRAKVSDGRLVRFWNNASELSGLVSLSLNKTIKMYPAVGWVRANIASSSELLTEINSLRKANEALRLQLEQNSESSLLISEDDLAGWTDSFKIKGTYKTSGFSGNAQIIAWECIGTWQKIFSLVSPMISDGAFNEEINIFLAKQFASTLGSQKKYYLRIDDQVFYTIRIQFLALGLIEVKHTDANPTWGLTEKGHQLMIKERAVFR
ncbi:MAG: hypothetical protein DSY85_16205 [Marinomonas sp.]|nr:MAG: hypothetical protein DSY85_16205 [Marinomonas sp.]